MTHRSKVRAFTLIELLTVVAIITLLISILTPSLSRARAQAKATACGARMHEMGLALTVYANDGGGYLPVAEFQTETPVAKWGWAELIGEQNYRYKPTPDPNEPFPVQRNTRNIGRYFAHYFNCPALGKEADHTGHYRVYLPAWSYGSLKRDGTGKITAAADPLKSTVLESAPPQLPLLGDARGGVQDDPNAASSYIGGGEAEPGVEGAVTFDDRHYGRVNLLFNDGHIELVPYNRDYSENLFVKLNDDWDLNGVEDTP